MVASDERRAARLTYASILGSLVVAVGLGASYVVFKSQLALAQAADSFSDMFAGGALAWAVWQAGKPADEGHPLGHDRAEPLAALVVALLAGVLSVEVIRNAVTALVTGHSAELDWPVAAAFASKVVFKATIVGLASRAQTARGNPALDALRIDARNDVLVGLVALVGFGTARWSLPAVDAWLAIATAIYVGVSGVRLARENIGLLLGAAAPRARTESLRAVAENVDGVDGVDELIATWAGPALHVQVDIAVGGQRSVREAHDIAHAVEARLVVEPDVARVVVHVGPSPTRV